MTDSYSWGVHIQVGSHLAAPNIARLRIKQRNSVDAKLTFQYKNSNSQFVRFIVNTEIILQVRFPL
jgi:hypothetical protein